MQRAIELGEDYDLDLEIITAKGNTRAVHTIGKADLKHRRIYGFIQDITEQKQAEEALRASEGRLRSLFASMTEIVVLHELVFDEDGRPVNYRILDCNPAFTRITGIRSEDAVGRLATDVYGSDSAPYLDEYARVAMTGEPCTFITAYTPMDKHFDVHVASPGRNTFVTVTTDITERKQAELYREIGREVLQILNEPGDLQESIQRILTALKMRTGVDAVGLRLQEGEDFPYFAQDGFSQDFLLTENTLVERGKDGGVCRDKDGNVCLECTCGLVISGHTDPTNPLFTKGGSCWTNDSFPLLELPSEQDPRRHPRNNCIHQGYASVALIPVRIQDQMHSRETCIRNGFSSIAQVPVRTRERIVGLIQLNDKRPGRFTLETIEILEGIAAHIGAALMRKRAESELRESKELHERLALDSRTIAWTTDADGLYTFISTAVETILGYRQDEIVGKLHVYDLHPEEGREDFKKMAFAVIQRKDDLSNLDNPLQAKDGSIVWVTSNARPILDADGSLKGYRGSDQDITERKQAEQELVRLSTAIEQAAEVVVITDAQGTIQYVNPVFEKVTGYTRAEVIGQTPRLLKSGKQDAEFYRGMWAALTAGEVFACRMVNRRKDGTLYTEEATISPVKDAAGRILNYVAVKRDITAHLRAEEERAELKSQLTQAQKMESVGRLAGGVAHDFNNLLMGIMGYTELCQEEIALDHPIREFLDAIRTGAQRSTEITRQLLAFARKQTIAPRVLDLNDAVGGMLKLLRRLIGEDVKLTWRPGSDLRRVKLDPAQMDQILANLCVNAQDAIGGVGEIALETGSVVIGAELCAQYPEAIPGAYVFLAVSDNGCGMDQETLAQIFEPFFTTKGVGEGTGLGLATVYGIVKQNHGFIDAYSELGRGTTFRIFLPAIAAEAPAPVTDQAAAPAGRGETVLVVEDAPAVRKTCGQFLKALGYKALEAGTPEEALVIAKRHGGDIHLVLTDVVMPGMDGRQLAQRLSAVKPGVKVVFMSGYTADVIAQRGVLDEGVQFLSKPFTRDDLARKMRAVLDGPCPG
ncbi:MAG: PAS domain S-box protein [Candidatus Marinimicrobia bacterium]|nr:PAS domain S-box protein [Candidatus Neomarinimicrobiota bacterium]